MRIVSIGTETIKDDIDVIASIESEHRYNLYSPVEGIVSNMQYSLGDDVYKGQELATVEKKHEQLIDSQTETRLSNSVTQYTLAIQQSNDELRRINNAVKAGVLPRYKLDEVRSSLERASSNRAAAENELSSYQRDKRNKKAIIKKQTIIKALSDGVITKKSAYEGQWLRSGDEVLSIVSTDDLTIRAMMSPKQVSQLALGQDVTVSKQNSTVSWLEQIVRISPIISQNPNTKNLQEVTISLVNADNFSKSINEKLNIKINSPTSNENKASLPIDAVIRDGKEFYVLYIDKRKKASLGEIYSQKGLLSALKILKCQFNDCNVGVYGLSKKDVRLGNSDLNRVQINQDMAQDIKIIVPTSGMDENSLVTLGNDE